MGTAESTAARGRTAGRPGRGVARAGGRGIAPRGASRGRRMNARRLGRRRPAPAPSGGIGRLLDGLLRRR